MGTTRIKHKIKMRNIIGDEPLITNGLPRCPYCNKIVSEPNSFVMLSLSISELISDNSPEASCELAIGFHDAHNNINEDKNAIGKIRNWPIVQGDQLGALGLFCSTTCLRHWFNVKIDIIEDYLTNSGDIPPNVG